MSTTIINTLMEKMSRREASSIEQSPKRGFLTSALFGKADAGNAKCDKPILNMKSAGKSNHCQKVNFSFPDLVTNDLAKAAKAFADINVRDIVHRLCSPSLPIKPREIAAAFEVVASVAQLHLQNSALADALGPKERKFLDVAAVLFFEIPEVAELLAHKKGKALLAARFPPDQHTILHKTFVATQPLVHELKKVFLSGERMTLSDAVARLKKVDSALSDDEAKRLIQLGNVPRIGNLFGGDWCPGAEKTHTRSVIVGTPKTGDVSTRNQMQTFFRKSSFELFDLINLDALDAKEKKYHLDSLVDQLNLHDIKQRPLKDLAPGDRYDALIFDFLKWCIMAHGLLDVVQGDTKLSKFFNFSCADDPIFADFQNYSDSLDTGVLGKPLNILKTTELRQLTQQLCNIDLLSLVGRFAGKQPKDAAALWFSVREREAQDNHAIKSDQAEVLNHLTLPGLEKNRRNCVVTLGGGETTEIETHQAVVGSIEACHAMAEDGKTYNGPGRVVHAYSFGTSPKTERELLATLKLGMMEGRGVFQYISPERLAAPSEKRMASSVEFLLQHQARLELLNSKLGGLEIGGKTYAVSNVTPHSHEGYGDCTRSALVTLTNQLGEQIRVPFTDVALPYSNSGLNQQNLDKGLAIEDAHNALCESARSNLRIGAIQSPLVLSRGGINRCAQHILVRDQKKWMAHQQNVIEDEINVEIDRGGDIVSDRPAVTKLDESDVELENKRKLSYFLLNRVPARLGLALQQIRGVAAKAFLGTETALGAVLESVESDLGNIKVGLEKSEQRRDAHFDDLRTQEIV